ncbi:hypothetical protein [Arthrobacter flavus]|uniref:Uncharacterized protein n=1 Tax=Arthrobacter flavus TaxID=95172 RepID=A0ABW4Q8R9_9MICC
MLRSLTSFFIGCGRIILPRFPLLLMVASGLVREVIAAPHGAGGHQVIGVLDDDQLLKSDLDAGRQSA